MQEEAAHTFAAILQACSASTGVYPVEVSVDAQDASDALPAGERVVRFFLVAGARYPR